MFQSNPWFDVEIHLKYLFHVYYLHQLFLKQHTPNAFIEITYSPQDLLFSAAVFVN